MSLNPQLYTVQVMSGRRSKTSSFPLPYAGEYICASRDQSHFKVEGDPRFKYVVYKRVADDRTTANS